MTMKTMAIAVSGRCDNDDDEKDEVMASVLEAVVAMVMMMTTMTTHKEGRSSDEWKWRWSRYDGDTEERSSPLSPVPQ